MNKQQTRILQDLQIRSYTTITVKRWDIHFRSRLLHWLKQQGYHQCQFYRLNKSSHTYVIALPGAYLPSGLLIQEYQVKRGPIRLLLPLLSLFVLLYLTLTMSKHMGKITEPAIAMGVPIILGMLAEYFINLNKPAVSIKTMFINTLLVALMIFLAVLFVAGEGAICIIMLLPFILGLPFLGIIIMRLICRFFWKPGPKIYSLAFLPLTLMATMPSASSDHYGQTQRSVIIHAPIEQVFHEIQYIGQIKPEEVNKNFIFVMGLPKPIYGMTEQHKGQTIRHMQWQRGVDFKEVVVREKAPYALSWIYQFKPDSFPKETLDEHVQIGGKYFNLIKAGYQLQKIDQQTTQLTLTVNYRLSTEYNWYSKLWADYMLNQFSDVVMAIPKQRLEQKT